MISYFQRVAFLLKNAVVIDIGGYIGDTAIYFALKGARVLAFEPHPYLFYLLKTNVALNSLENKIMVYNLAVGDKHHVVELREPENNAYKTLGITTEGKGRVVGYAEQVPAGWIIDQFDAIDLIKFNCEGCEYPSILSLDPKQLRRIKFSLIHIHEHAIYTQYALVKKLRESGFKLLVKVAQPSVLVYANSKYLNSRN